MRRLGLAWAGGVALLLLSGCEPKAAELSLELITTGCSAPQAFDGVTHVRVLVTGEGIKKPVEQTATVNQHALHVTGIPSGLARRIEVRGYIKDPAEGGRVFSVGRSGTFDVSATATLKGGTVPLIRVVMRPVNTFVKPSSRASLGTCTQMTVPRAGHTASVLPDGRVYLSGGYNTDSAGVRTMLSSAEIYDPALGTFTATADLPGDDGARAFHTANVLPGGTVFIAGGAGLFADGGAAVRSSGYLFHADSAEYERVQLSVGRAHHGAGQVSGGNTLLVGGIGQDGQTIDTLEWLQADAGFTQVLTDRLAVADAAVLGTGDGTGVVVVGGTVAVGDAAAPLGSAQLFSFSQGSFVPSVTAALATPRLDAAVVPFQDAAHLLVVGGATTSSETVGFVDVGSTELLTTSGGALTRADGPALSPRGNVCAVVMAEGQVLVSGGMNQASGAGQADATVELITFSASGEASSLGMPTLPQPRYGHACVPLPDGSALITGGADNTGTHEEVLQEALIFMPSPRS